jgi:hypothetical protein
MCVGEKEPGPAAAKPEIEVVRDLTLLAPGRYWMVQAWEMTGKETNQKSVGAGSKTQALAGSNRFSFAVQVKPESKEIVAVVKRVEVQVDQGGEALVYDSDKPVAQQSPIFERQFHHLTGRTARTAAAAFSDGRGFVGLDAAWDQFGKENPDLFEVAVMNQANYGDARLDRMFTRGLDLLYGADAGRAKGLIRKLREGDEFRAVLEREGIGMQPTVVQHVCKVLSAESDEVVVRVEWKINGSDPKLEAGHVVTHGGDIHGVSMLTFLPRGGLLIRIEETIERTDQRAPGRRPGESQWTMRSTEKRSFSLVKDQSP